MSLITLTFGSDSNRDKPNLGKFADREVLTPADNIEIAEGEENVFKVKKADQFFKREEVVLIGEVVSGAIKEGMHLEINGAKAEVLEVESKYGAVAKRGLTACLTVLGAPKAVFQKDLEVTLKN